MTTQQANLNQATPQNAAAVVAGQAEEFLTIWLGKEEYGIEILKVQEIRGWEQPTTIANAPEFIKGVINLRGTIVPIIDMRIKFGLGEAEYNALTVVIILNVAKRVVGIVVDAVSDVITLGRDQIRPAPQFGAALDTQHIVGLGTIEERMLILLDIERLMCSPDMALMDSNSIQ
jgi:purine-binding chemotaxis protein CheW